MRLFSDQRRLLLNQYQSQNGQLAGDLADEAIAAAYRTIGSRLSWAYLHRRTQINTVAPQSTGTIAYTASTRVATLTGATWPSWSTNGLILLNGQVYAVQQVTSSTTAILAADRSPVSDVASGTAYTLVQSEYLLPANFVRLEEMVPIGQIWPMRELAPGSMLELARLFSRPTRPWQFMVRGSTYAPGRMAVEYGPPPDQAYTFDMTYYASPRQRTLGYENTQGEISISGTTVTGTSTAFTSAMVGCRLRVGTNGKVPVGEFGRNGSQVEYTIASVSSATSLTLLESAATVSNVQFLIDDPVDIDRMSMDEAFCRVCEYEFETLFHGEKRGQKEEEMNAALRRARAFDLRLSRSQYPNIPVSLEGLAYANLQGR